MHKNTHKIRYNFLFENYSFQYKITKIMENTVFFITICPIYKFIDLAMRFIYLVCD